MQNIRIARLGLAIAIACATMAAAPVPPSDAVPSHTPTNATVQQRNQQGAQKLLKADKHIRGRIHHGPDYAARQQAEIHRARGAYLRNKGLAPQ